MKRKKEEWLVKAIQEGNEEAFQELWRRYEKLTYYIAYELCHNKADAEDIVQSVWVQVHQHIQQLQDTKHFKAWLNRIVINRCRNFYRSKKEIACLDDETWIKEVQENHIDALPKARQRKQADQDLVRKLIRQLPYAQQEVLILRYFQELSMKEMAEVLQISEGTVKTRLLYGKRNLKKHIMEYEEAEDIKITFRVSHMALAGLYAAGFLQISGVPKRKICKWQMQQIGLMTLVSVAACTLFVLANPLIHAEDKEMQSIINKVDTQAKQNYFMLMQWACCEDEIAIKEKADFIEIEAIYNNLKASNTRYYQRLKQDAWVSAYEKQYEIVMKNR